MRRNYGLGVVYSGKGNFKLDIFITCIMRKFVRLSVGIITFILGITFALSWHYYQASLAAHAQLEQQANEILKEWHGVLYRRDREELNNYLPDNFVHIDMDGTIRNKREFIEKITDPNLTLVYYQDTNGVDVSIDGERVRLKNLSCLRVKSKEISTDEMIYPPVRSSDIFETKNSQLKLVSIQVTRMPY